MDIKRSGSQPSGKGPADYFTGTVRIDPLFSAPAPARAVGASVTFEPGARTAWHTHPLGQTLIVTAGCGRAQRWGGPIEEIRPGDVVSFTPGEKHWHGAAPTTAMTHIAIQEQLDGQDCRMDGKGERRTVPGVTKRGSLKFKTCSIQLEIRDPATPFAGPRPPNPNTDPILSPASDS